MSVTVIIPHYNMDAFIAEAVASVVAQGDLVRELIILDDGSDPERWERAQWNCIEVLRGVNIPTEAWYHNQENRGQGAVLNQALLSAHEEFVAFLDADDVWLPNKLELQLKVMQSEASFLIHEDGYGGCYGHARQFVHAPVAADRVFGEPRPAPLVSGLMVRREIMKAFPFEEGTGAGMTIEWFARLHDAGVPIVQMPDLLFHRRLHGDNYGVRCRDQARGEYMRTLREIELRRRREAKP